MEQEVVSTRQADVNAAVQDLCAKLKRSTDSYQAVIFMAAITYDFDRLSQAIKERFPHSEVLGTSTAGEISPEGFANGSIVLTTMYSPETQVAGAMVENGSTYPVTGAQALKSALQRCGIRCKDPSSGKHAFAITFINGVFNAIFVKGNAIGDAMFYGQGAGSLPTASAVVADVIDASRDILHDNFGRVRCTCYEEKPICPIDKTESSYYVRLLVDDKPGVLGYVATAFGNAGVSLESVIQTHRNIVDHAEIVAISHRVEHAQIEAALAALKALPVVDEIRSVIRVEQERG